MSTEFGTVQEIIDLAAAALPRNVHDHIAGAAGTETTMRRNRLALDSLAFRPRVLNDVSEIDMTSTLLGHELRLPVLLAPIGSLQMIRPGAAAEAVRAAGRFGVVGMVSSVVEPGFEAIAAEAEGPKLFQLYVRGDAVHVADVIDRVKASGYSAIAVTVDSAYYGIRDRQLLSKFHAPAHRRGGREYQPRITWETVAEIRERAAPLPVMLKGVQTHEDAARAVSMGIDALYVSNHGGRQLDHCRATIDVLPEIVDVAGDTPVIVDGGFMRGTDILKAIALGAKAVGLGRLYAWSLAAGGEDAVIRALEILEGEMRNAMGLLGVTNLQELHPGFIAAAMPVPPAGAQA